MTTSTADRPARRGVVVSGLCVRRAGAPVLSDVYLVAPAGEVTVLLGSNGAGKTTLIEAISGVIPADSGTIALDGVDQRRVGRMRRARKGLAHVEQGHRVFPGLTVEENLRVAGRGRPPADAYALFPSLQRRKDVSAGALSGGEQQMLALARALGTEPSVLLVDEMSLGLAPAITAELLPLLDRMAREGVAVLLVEQFASLALRYGTTAYVMAKGRISDSAPCADLLADSPRLHRAYFAEVGVPQRDGGTTS